MTRYIGAEAAGPGINLDEILLLDRNRIERTTPASMPRRERPRLPRQPRLGRRDKLYANET
jgi:hypothetical protein